MSMAGALDAVECMTPKAREHRVLLQETLRSHLKSGVLSRLDRPELAALQRAPDVFAPVVDLQGTRMCDSLCAVLEANDQTLALFHGRRQAEGPEGVGRTSLLLRYLGVEIEPSTTSLDPREISAAGPPRLLRRPGQYAALVCSDWAYLAPQDGRLVAVPAVAEPMLGLWDVARYLYRTLDPGYYSGKRLRPEGREILKALFRKCPALDYFAVYTDIDRARLIDTAVVMELSSDVSTVEVREPASFEESRDALRLSMLSVLYLKTPFWDRVKSKYKRLVDLTLQNLATPPRVVRVLIPTGPAASARGAANWTEAVCERLHESGIGPPPEQVRAVRPPAGTVRRGPVAVPESDELRIAEWLRPPTRNRQQQVMSLSSWMRRKERCIIKVSCYTLQTTLSLLDIVLESLGDAGSLRSLDVHILRPDLSSRLSIWRRNQVKDRAYWREKKKDAEWSHKLRGQMCSRYPSLRFHEAVFHSDPCIKAVVVNDEHAFFGMYALKRRYEADADSPLDYMGVDTKLVELNRDAHGALFDLLVGWFDWMWSLHKGT